MNRPDNRVRKEFFRPSNVMIGDDAWIGAGAIILPGVMIGEGSIISAGAVVTHSTEPRAIYAGVPARFIREIPDAAIEENAGPWETVFDQRR